jgi:hypothetical protein
LHFSTGGQSGTAGSDGDEAGIDTAEQAGYSSSRSSAARLAWRNQIGRSEGLRPVRVQAGTRRPSPGFRTAAG